MNIIDNYKTNFTKIIWKYAKKKKKSETYQKNIL